MKCKNCKKVPKQPISYVCFDAECYVIIFCSKKCINAFIKKHGRVSYLYGN